MPISKINTTSITDNSVTAGKIVAGAVDADIAAGSIDTAQIADDAVTTAKIPNDAVTADKLANSINTSIAVGASALPLAGGTMTGDTAHGDNVKAKFGTGNDLNIYHDGSDSYIKDDGTGSLWVASNEFRVANAGVTENMIIATENAAVKLYHNNALKLETTATGVAVTGGVALGGTGAANTLDDYEEGTFTPGGTGINTGTSVGLYTKIGNICHTQMWVHANGSTDGTITGLPFTQGHGSSNAIAAGTIAYQNGSVTGIVSSGANTSITMYNGTSTGSLASGNQMHCAFTFRTT